MQIVLHDLLGVYIGARCLMQEVVEMPLRVDHFLGRDQTGSCQDAVRVFC